MTHDEILAIAKETDLYQYLAYAGSILALEKFFALAYSAGAKDMRERAARAICTPYAKEECYLSDLQTAIRNLEVKCS